MVTRRIFLKLLGGGAAAAALPWACGDNVDPNVRLFFDAHQWATIDAATALVLPAGKAGISASDALAVRYIDHLLGAFEVMPPMIFAGGPASGRQAVPDAHGVPTQSFPPDAMATFLPLSRVREIAWRVRIYGSAQTPGGDFNDALLGPTVGWRDLYTDAVTRLDAAAAALQPGATFVDLAPDDQGHAFATVSSAVPAWADAIVEHTLEGTFAIPEYGGNAGRVGWRMAHYDGDSVPLGHSFYDAMIDAYVDRADEPTSTPSAGSKPETLDDDVLGLITIAALGSGGKQFF